MTVGALVLAPQPATADPIVLPDLLGSLPIDSGDALTCTELTPHAISHDSTPVRLDVRILLDGVKRAEAKRAVVFDAQGLRPIADRGRADVPKGVVHRP